MRFCVSVPVLSEQRISIPASSSMASRRLTIACFFASAIAPMAIVTVSTAGIATGMAEMVSTSEKISSSVSGSSREMPSSTIMAITAKVSRMRKLPTLMTICSKWLRPSISARATSPTVLPKRVLSPVAVTIATISPCLTVVLAKASSPGLRLTGSDSPVSAD